MQKQIEEVMALVDEWGMASHLRGEAELDAHHPEATQEETDCAKDRVAKERAAWSAIESKLRELLPVWQPIETAPKDGSCIILGREASEDRDAISAPGFWIDGADDAPDEIGYDAGFTDVNFQTFSTGRSFGVESYQYAAFQPTLWMPLPKAPE